MKRWLPALLAIHLLLGVRPATAQNREAVRSPLTLPNAVSMALTGSPAVAGADHQRDASAALADSRDGAPNPELSVEAEDFLGTGSARGVDGMQVTAVLSRTVELGGKAGKRRAARRARHTVSSEAAELTKRLVVEDVSLAFLNVLGWQRRLETAREMVRLAKETQTAIEYQVEAGRGTPVEADKAAIAHSLAVLEEERVARALLSAKERLALACGAESIEFGSVTGRLERIQAIPSLAELRRRINAHPAMKTSQAEVKHQRALGAVERARRTPDLAVGLGYRFINATNDSAVVVQAGLPLPIVDRNRGAINAARHQELVARSVADQERLRLLGEISDAHNALVLEHRRAVVLRDEIRPRVLATYRAVSEGYQLGRFGYLDLLDAQRTLFEVTAQTTDTLIAYHQSAIRLAQSAALPLLPASFQ